MTPARLVKLKCPSCSASHWVIDCDFPGESTPSLDLPYEARSYECPHCGFNEKGYIVEEGSPPEFFLQPHDMYPMEPREFEKWVAIFREHFPGHPTLADFGTKWYAGKRR